MSERVMRAGDSSPENRLLLQRAPRLSHAASRSLMRRDFLDFDSPTFPFENSDTKSSPFVLRTRTLLPPTAIRHHHKCCASPCAPASPPPPWTTLRSTPFRLSCAIASTSLRLSHARYMPTSTRTVEDFERDRAVRPSATLLPWQRPASKFERKLCPFYSAKTVSRSGRTCTIILHPMHAPHSVAGYRDSGTTPVSSDMSPSIWAFSTCMKA